MKNIVKIMICGLLVTLLQNSCDLDRFPYDAIVAENITVGAAESMTLGSYARMKAENYCKVLFYVGEYSGDNVIISGTTSDPLEDMLLYRRSNTNGRLRNVWEDTYVTLNNINMLVPILEDYDGPEQRHIDHMLGENLLMRAHLFFELNRIFGRTYLDANGAANNLGIPLKTIFDANDAPPRASVAEVYTQILADATRAAELMERLGGDIPKSSIFITQEVAWALLSRVYLYMGDWANAEKYADLVISSGRYTLLQGRAYQEYPQHVPESNSETIWAQRMVKDVDFHEFHMADYSIGSMLAVIDGVGWGEIYPSEPFLELLRKNPDDLRWGFIENVYEDSNEMQMTYVVRDPEAPVQYTYEWKTVVPEGNSYRIVEDADLFTNEIVQRETTPQGNIQFFVNTTDGTRYNVIVERELEKRGGIPKRFILKCSYQEQQSHLWSPVFYRLAEMHLNRAEARYHLENLSGAIEDINVIRRRAGIPERAVVSGAQVLEWVLEERRIELAFEGHRKHDVFRYQQTMNRHYPGHHQGRSPLEIPPDDLRVVELIPQREIDAYPVLLEQNP